LLEEVLAGFPRLAHWGLKGNAHVNARRELPAPRGDGSVRTMAQTSSPI